MNKLKCILAFLLLFSLKADQKEFFLKAQACDQNGSLCMQQCVDDGQATWATIKNELEEGNFLRFLFALYYHFKNPCHNKCGRINEQKKDITLIKMH